MLDIAGLLGLPASMDGLLVGGLALGGLLLGMLALWLWLDNRQIMPLDRKAVFITGCDTGFGHELALHCARHAMPVFAGCLTEKGGEDLKVAARWLPGPITIVPLNVGSDESVKTAVEQLERETAPYGGLHAVVNNAGISGLTFFDDCLTVDDYKQCAEINLWGVVRVTHACKQLVKRVRGRFVVVASVCGRMSVPGFGPYSVSKYGVEAYYDTLRREMLPFGVSVHILEPGFFKTNITNPERIAKMTEEVWRRTPAQIQKEYGEEFFQNGTKAIRHLLESGPSGSIQQVVDAYFHAITSRWPRVRYPVGVDAHLLFLPFSWLPGWIQDVIVQLVSIAAKIPTPAAALHSLPPAPTAITTHK